MSANDYWIASRIDAPADPNHGCWEIVNQRNRTRAGDIYDRQADARARADELNGAAFMNREDAA